MDKRLRLSLCLLTLVALGCTKSAPAENPSAQLKGPSQEQMQNTYANAARMGSQRGGPPGSMGRPGAGAPYGAPGAPR